jgi:hypothetical protein
MERQKDKILYRYEEIANGARVRIITTDSNALHAVRDFLRFHIVDHGTGETLEVSKSQDNSRQ